jgi:hypothetical protein
MKMRDLNNLNSEHGNVVNEKKSQRITDKEVYEAIEAVKKDEEGSIATALTAILATVVDLRAFVRKLYKEIVPKKERHVKK